MDESSLVIDCGTCVARGPACAECVVTAMLGPPGVVQVEPDEWAALDVLAQAGLVPPLRLEITA